MKEEKLIKILFPILIEAWQNSDDKIPLSLKEYEDSKKVSYTTCKELLYNIIKIASCNISRCWPRFGDCNLCIPGFAGSLCDYFIDNYNSVTVKILLKLPFTTKDVAYYFQNDYSEFLEYDSLKGLRAPLGGPVAGQYLIVKSINIIDYR